MTPKEKAQELYNKIHFALGSYPDEGQQEHKSAKECALIAVNLILEDGEIIDGMRVEYDPYWLEVKQEIEKL